MRSIYQRKLGSEDDLEAVLNKPKSRLKILEEVKFEGRGNFTMRSELKSVAQL